MADQELIYDFITRFSDASSFSDNINFDYQLSCNQRCITIYFNVKFNYEKLITNNYYVNSNDIKSHFYKIKKDIINYGFLKENQIMFSRVFFESDDEEIWNKKVLEKIIKPRIREIGDGSIHGISFKRGDDDLYPRIKITFKISSRHNIRKYVVIRNIREMLTKEFNLHPRISVFY